MCFVTINGPTVSYHEGPLHPPPCGNVVASLTPAQWQRAEALGWPSDWIGLLRCWSGELELPCVLPLLTPAYKPRRHGANRQELAALLTNDAIFLVGINDLCRLYGTRFAVIAEWQIVMDDKALTLVYNPTMFSHSGAQKDNKRWRLVA
jgi:hypothetical protein